MKEKLVSGWLGLLVFVFSCSAMAESYTKKHDPAAPAIKNQLFTKAQKHELTPAFAMTTNDPFYQNYHVGLSYNYHFADWVSLGLSGFYSIATPTGLTNSLLNDQTLQVTPDVRKSLAHIAIEARFAPIYGKMNLFSEAIVHYDFFFLVTGGLFITNPPQVTGQILGDSMGFHPFGGVGVGQRYFFLKWLALRWEFRGLLMTENFKRLGDQSQLRVDLAINIGFSFFL